MWGQLNKYLQAACYLLVRVKQLLELKIQQTDFKDVARTVKVAIKGEYMAIVFEFIA